MSAGAVQAAEDLVLCALVRSAITASSATGTAQARTTLPVPQTSTGVITPLQLGAREPPRPQGPQVAQVAAAPTVPTAQLAPSAGSAGGSATSGSAAPLAGNASRNGGSLAALLAQPLPMASDAAEAILPISASPAATGSTAASRPLSTSAVALHGELQPAAAAPAASTSAAPVATHAQQRQPQPRPVAGPAPQGSLAVGGMQATLVPGLHNRSSALPAASAVALPYSSAQQTPASAGHSLPLPGSSVQPSANSGQPFLGVGQQPQAGVATAVRPVGAGLPGATVLGRAGSGHQKALVGEDVWGLASDVLAAGGTATTVAAVTTAAQQVRHSYASTACQHLWYNRSDTAAYGVLGPPGGHILWFWTDPALLQITRLAAEAHV